MTKYKCMRANPLSFRIFDVYYLSSWQVLIIRIIKNKINSVFKSQKRITLFL